MKAIAACGAWQRIRLITRSKSSSWSSAVRMPPPTTTQSQAWDCSAAITIPSESSWPSRPSSAVEADQARLSRQSVLGELAHPRLDGFRSGLRVPGPRDAIWVQSDHEHLRRRTSLDHRPSLRPSLQRTLAWHQPAQRTRGPALHSCVLPPQKTQTVAWVRSTPHVRSCRGGHNAPPVPAIGRSSCCCRALRLASRLVWRL